MDLTSLLKMKAFQPTLLLHTLCFLVKLVLLKKRRLVTFLEVLLPKGLDLAVGNQVLLWQEGGDRVLLLRWRIVKVGWSRKMNYHKRFMHNIWSQRKLEVQGKERSLEKWR